MGGPEKSEKGKRRRKIRGMASAMAAWIGKQKSRGTSGRKGKRGESLGHPGLTAAWCWPQEHQPSLHQSLIKNKRAACNAAYDGKKPLNSTGKAA